MARFNRRHRNPQPNALRSAAQYASSGHPSVEQLITEQGTGPITDVSTLHGDFWPAEESVEDFLDALHEWRGHKRPDPAR